tara:strand:- start:54 stop:551 length:498 start_codon:yes stop_codon:yes gene_type:complete
MANSKLGSYSTYKSKYVMNIDSARQLTPGDSGKLFFLDGTSASYIIHLPKLSTKIIGWNCKMILDVAIPSSETIKIMAYGLPSAGGTSPTYADAESIRYTEYARNGGVGGTYNHADGIQLNDSSVIGNSLIIHCGGTHIGSGLPAAWYIEHKCATGSDAGNVDTD